MPSLWGAAEPERPRTGQRPQDIGGIRRFRARGTPTALCVRRGAVQRLLTATGFDRIVPTFASVEDARQALLAATAPPEVAPA